MTYRYTINGADVSPKGDWEINHERNVGQIFFRRVLTGDLTFIGDDYRTIMGMSDCDVLDFIIYCGVSIHWEGQFKFPYDFDINEDSCSMVGTPEVVDEYSCIMNNYEASASLYPAGTLLYVHTCAGLLKWSMAAARGAARLVASTASGNANWLDQLINSAVLGPQCNLTISSSFMCRSDFPNGDNYAGAYGANNYITGAANRLEYVYMIPNNGLRIAMFGAGNGCDGYIELNFKTLETLLRNAFNAYWFIDENGHFRVEHIHYFDPDFAHSDFQSSIDLTKLVSSNGKVFAYHRNKYTYETGNLYDQERWTWQHYEETEAGYAHGVDFEGVPIFYGSAINQKSDCVPGNFKEKEFAIPNMWTDIPWAVLLFDGAGVAGDINCPGFCLMDIDSGTSRVRCEVGILSAANQINGHLSTANLQDHYFTWDRIFLDGDMNTGTVVLFDSEQKHKIQEAIEFEHCCLDGFDPLDLITTELGEGAVKSAVQKKRSIEIELLY